jgi:hypothetical protein
MLPLFAHAAGFDVFVFATPGNPNQSAAADRGEILPSSGFSQYPTDSKPKQKGPADFHGAGVPVSTMPFAIVGALPADTDFLNAQIASRPSRDASLQTGTPRTNGATSANAPDTLQPQPTPPAQIQFEVFAIGDPAQTSAPEHPNGFAGLHPEMGLEQNDSPGLEPPLTPYGQAAESAASDPQLHTSISQPETASTRDSQPPKAGDLNLPNSVSSSPSLSSMVSPETPAHAPHLADSHPADSGFVRYRHERQPITSTPTTPRDFFDGLTPVWSAASDRHNFYQEAHAHRFGDPQAHASISEKDSSPNVLPEYGASAADSKSTENETRTPETTSGTGANTSETKSEVKPSASKIISKDFPQAASPPIPAPDTMGSSASGITPAGARTPPLLGTQPTSNAAGKSAASPNAIHVADVNEAALASPTIPQVHAARIIQSDADSQMRVEMRSQALGEIEIHASVSGREVQLAVSADRGDLHSVLAPELPSLQHALEQHGLRLEHVRTYTPNHSSGAAADFFSGSGGREQRFHRPNARLPATYESQQEPEAPASDNAITRVNIRI